MKQRPTKPGFVCVGVIAAAHGIRGEVTVKAFTENPLDITAYGVPEDSSGTSFRFLNLRATPKGVIAKVEGVTDRNAAEKLRGTALFVPEENLPELEDDTNAYFAELMQMDVFLEDGEEIGAIIHVFDNGAHAVFEVKPVDGGKTYYVPFVEGVVLGVDRDDKVLVVSEEIRAFAALSS